VIGRNLSLSPTKGGVILAVRAVPRAGRSGIAGLRAGALLVRLAAAPVDDAANAELLSVLSNALRLPRRQLTIVGGAHARAKRVRIEGVSLDALRASLSAILET
jgi:uncharacterized protein